MQAAGKMGGHVATLQYGSRDSYIRGVQDIVSKPVLTMEQEFMRECTWTDWKGVKYTLREARLRARTAPRRLYAWNP